MLTDSKSSDALVLTTPSLQKGGCWGRTCGLGLLLGIAEIHAAL